MDVTSTNLVTPRYGEDFREQVGTVKTDWRFTPDQYYSRKNVTAAA